MDKPNWEEFCQKKDEAVKALKCLEVEELPPVIIFDYYGFRVDITEEVLQN